MWTDTDPDLDWPSYILAGDLREPLKRAPGAERMGNPPGLTFAFAEDGSITVQAWDKTGSRCS